MIIVHAYTTITVHVSYTVGLVFLGGEAPQVSREVWGAARPPDVWWLWGGHHAT